jgi:hypothetical protein
MSEAVNPIETINTIETLNTTTTKSHRLSSLCYTKWQYCRIKFVTVARILGNLCGLSEPLLATDLQPVHGASSCKHADIGVFRISSRLSVHDRSAKQVVGLAVRIAPAPERRGTAGQRAGRASLAPALGTCRRGCISVAGIGPCRPAGGHLERHSVSSPCRARD